MRSLSELNALINAGQNFSRKQLTESSFKASIESYKKLLGEQDEVLTSNGDVEALKYGIQQFPSLERITLTPTTHGVLLNPIYETPMIRSLRSSAVYPLPPGLQYYPRRQFSTISWNESFYRVLEEDRRNKWRGFRVITKVLAETSHNISQFVIKTHHMDTGISSDLLHQPCPELDNLTALIQTPGFRRLDLAVNLGGYGMHQLLEYRARYLHEALAKAVNLEHFSLRGTDSRRKYALCMANKEERENISLWLSLEDIFPVQRWSRLKHFGISKLWITQSDLLSLLASLPETLRSVELSFLAFQTRDDSYRSLLYKMRNGIILDWRKRPEGQRPVVKIAVETHDYCAQGHVIRVDEAANAFLYGSGENPFSDEHPCSVIDGMGVVRSEIDPTYEETYTRPPNYRGYSTF
ncbi:hypothetical protein QQS21_007159 [Conoideocrella luteorostrata]|uniref:Uncharacterized protein n=1 Tax=Conoideocrella luteorostrata TaxID=1105319 RepID=A0AAJ0CL98_9HYPO|nr:hypothetical protein QQS21_007159 [Conoideocrella luteorostrata]